ncbi:MAG: hypothetical protein IK102_08735 [Treponema sp.]|nr:hypothetical protein [Treponema sp.]
MKKFIKHVFAVAAILSTFIICGCASKTSGSQTLSDEAFTSRIILVASGEQRLVKFEMPDNKILPDVDIKNIKAATLKLELYSGRKPKEGENEGTPVLTLSFDLLKDAEKLVKGYDLMAAEKEIKLSAQELNDILSKQQYYYAKGKFEATVKEGKKTKTLYSNDTVYTPLD